MRGKKRELEDGVVQPAVNPAGPGALPTGVGAHPGVGTAWPRPIKKQRTVSIPSPWMVFKRNVRVLDITLQLILLQDIQGSREIPVQQPTPQPT